MNEWLERLLLALPNSCSCYLSTVLLRLVCGVICGTAKLFRPVPVILIIVHTHVVGLLPRLLCGLIVVLGMLLGMASGVLLVCLLDGLLEAHS